MYTLKFYYAGTMSKFDEKKGTFDECKKELFEQICFKIGCTGEVSSWQELDQWASRNDRFVSWSPKKDFASVENYRYEIVKE